MYRCFGNLNSFGFVLFFFHLEDFLLHLKQACRGFKSTTTFATTALPREGCSMEQQWACLCLVSAGTPSSPWQPCCAKQPKDFELWPKKHESKLLLIDSSPQPRRSLLETHVRPTWCLFSAHLWAVLCFGCRRRHLRWGSRSAER